MERRYMGNIPSITLEEQDILKTKHVLVVGCGGVGGYTVEYLARAGVGKITILDNGSFAETDLNHQIHATRETVGKDKVTAIKERIRQVNPNTEVEFWMSKLRKATIGTAMSKKDLVIDGTETVEERLILEHACEEKELYLVHGSVYGWMAQVMVASPGKRSLRTYYEHNAVPFTKSTLPFVPAVCAGMQTAEAMKLLLGRETSLADRMMIWDMKELKNFVVSPEDTYFKEREIEIYISKYHEVKEVYSVPEKTTVKEILTVLRMEGENLYILRNGNYVMPEDFDTPILEEGDHLEVRKAAYTG